VIGFLQSRFVVGIGVVAVVQPLNMGRLTTFAGATRQLRRGVSLSLLCSLVLSVSLESSAKSEFWSEAAEKDLAHLRETDFKSIQGLYRLRSLLVAEPGAEIPHQKLVDRLITVPQVAPAILDMAIYGLDSYPYNPQLPGTVQKQILKNGFVSALGIMRYRPALAYVRSIAHSDKEIGLTREVAIQSLGYLGSVADAERFFVLVGDETASFPLRKSCLLALVRIGIPEVMDALTGYLLDPESEMYGAALAGLGELGSLAHRNELGPALDRKKIRPKVEELMIQELRQARDRGVEDYITTMMTPWADGETIRNLKKVARTSPGVAAARYKRVIRKLNRAIRSRN
jgi:hypothetical protein